MLLSPVVHKPEEGDEPAAAAEAKAPNGDSPAA
jgi:hypothetical protein